MAFQPNEIKVEAVEVRTENKTCPGMAKTKQGEPFIINARTPANSRGICSNSYQSLFSMAFVNLDYS